MEVHLVHKDHDFNALVIGVFYQMTEDVQDNPGLGKCYPLKNVLYMPDGVR